MLREVNVQRLHWADKTMSVIRTQQLEACEKRLALLPDVTLFDIEDERRVEELWRCSYDAQENPQPMHLHTLHELRAKVQTELPAQAALLSIEEHMLLERLITLNGQADLMDWEEMGAAESLVRRMWCCITRADGRIVLHLPDALLLPLTMVLSTRQHEEIRAKLMRHDAVIRGLLYIGGLLHYEEPLQHLVCDVIADTYADNYDMALRYMRVAYDFVYDRDGDMLLLHPGLADPDQLMLLPAPPEGMSVELDEMSMRGAMEGLMPEEEMLFDHLYGLLDGATRPEITVEGAVEDLRMLAKQGVPLDEMQEVLATLLTVHPTQDMREAVEMLHRLTPRWGTLRSATMQ